MRQGQNNLAVGCLPQAPVAGLVERVVDGNHKAAELVQLYGQRYQISRHVMGESAQRNGIGCHRLEAGQRHKADPEYVGNRAQNVAAPHQPALYDDLGQRPRLIACGVRLFLEVVTRHQSPIDEQLSQPALDSVHIPSFMQ